MNIKILGTGCPACRNMYTDVTKIVARNKIDAEVEYVQDIAQILSYGVMSTPALVIDGRVIMIGYRGPTKLEQALKESVETVLS
jgi:small redox-active disulfide protein 2